MCGAWGGGLGALGAWLVLDQFVEQCADAMVLLWRTSDGFVTHGTHTAHLQPLHQTLPVKSVLAWQHSQLIFDSEVLKAHGTRPVKIQLLRIAFQHHLPVAVALALGLVPEFADEVAAEDEAEDEDKDPGAEDDHVNIQRKVLERDGRHRA